MGVFARGSGKAYSVVWQKRLVLCEGVVKVMSVWFLLIKPFVFAARAGFSCGSIHGSIDLEIISRFLSTHSRPPLLFSHSVYLWCAPNRNRQNLVLHTISVCTKNFVDGS